MNHEPWTHELSLIRHGYSFNWWLAAFPWLILIFHSLSLCLSFSLFPSSPTISIYLMGMICACPSYRSITMLVVHPLLPTKVFVWHQLPRIVVGGYGTNIPLYVIHCCIVVLVDCEIAMAISYQYLLSWLYHQPCIDLSWFLSLFSYHIYIIFI